MSVVLFDYEQFCAMFPHIDMQGWTQEAAQLQWSIAEQIVGNTDNTSFAAYDPSKNVFERRTLLYLALAHLLQSTKANQAYGGLGGRLSSVSEGSVSVSIQPYTAKSSTAEYWATTPEGLQYWLLTAKYRLGGRLYTSKTYHPWT